jgi:predicted kinase
MPTIHLIHGFLGSGKTTFAEKLEEQTGAVRFDIDEWMMTLFGARPSSEVVKTYLSRVIDLIWLNCTQLIQRDMNVILDFGFWSRQSRDDARRRAALLGATVKLYRVTCSEVEMRRRALARDEAMPEGTLWIESATNQAFNEPFEPLGKDETHVEVYSE